MIMKNGKLLVLLALTLFVGAAFFVISAKNAASSAQTNPTSTPTATPKPTRWYGGVDKLPPEIIYEVTLKEIEKLSKKDGEAKSRGVTTNFKESFYANKLNLKSSQFDAVTNVTNDTLRQLKTLDERARVIIDQYRMQNSDNGKLFEKSAQEIQDEAEARMDFRINPLREMPETPNELKQLQQQRNQLSLTARRQIKNALGDAAFSAFDNAVMTGSTLVPLNLYSHQVQPAPSPLTTPPIN